MLVTFLVFLLCAFPSWMLVDKRKHLEVALARAEELGRTDPLTGLLNRAGLVEGFRSLVLGARAPVDVAGLLVIDVDHFKRRGSAVGPARGRGCVDVPRQGSRSQRDRLRGGPGS